MSIVLDPREILAHLNKMGYRNITAKQLKDFMTGLKQLIKYEAKYSNVNEFIEQLLTPPVTPLGPAPRPTPPTQATTAQFHQNTNNKPTHPLDNFERLYKTQTISSQANIATTAKKSLISQNKKENIQYTCSRHVKSMKIDTNSEHQNKENVNSLNCKPEFSLDTKIINDYGRSKQKSPPPPSASPYLHHQRNKNTTDRPVSCKSTKTQTSLTNQPQWIRNNPTDLYQHYQKDWQKFKNFIPGENSRSHIRQTIHHRMEHKPPPKLTVYVKYLAGDGKKEIKS